MGRRTRFHLAASRVHKWLALIIGAQLLIWFASGALMSFLPIDKVRGEHLVDRETIVNATKGTRIIFDWSVSGANVNFDSHGDPLVKRPGFYHGYGKGKASTGEQGTLLAAFDGSHGWYWRNRSDQPVTIHLQTSGTYSDIKRVV